MNTASLPNINEKKISFVNQYFRKIFIMYRLARWHKIFSNFSDPLIFTTFCVVLNTAILN